MKKSEDSLLRSNPARLRIRAKKAVPHFFHQIPHPDFFSPNQNGKKIRCPAIMYVHESGRSTMRKKKSDFDWSATKFDYELKRNPAKKTQKNPTTKQ